MRWRSRYGWRRFRLRVARWALRMRGGRVLGLAAALAGLFVLAATEQTGLLQSLGSWTGQGAALAAEGIERFSRRFAFKVDAELGKELIASVLPETSLGQLGPEPPGSWRTPLRAWVYRATGYDFTNPRSFLEGEIGGFRQAVSASFDIVRVPAHPGEGSGDGGGSAPGRGADRLDQEGPSAEETAQGAPAVDQPTLEPRLPPAAREPSGPREREWGDQPLVLIVHTHTSESYATDPPDPRADALMHVWNSSDTGVTRVGAALARKLQEEYGIGTIHSTRIHDWPNHWEAYNNARRTVEELLRRHPSIAAVFDIHRQGVENMYYAATIGGVEAVQVDILYTTAQSFTYGAHPGWRSNESFAHQLAQAMEAIHPGLLRRTIRVDDRRYNQDLHPRMLLLEVGNYLDSEARAIAAAELLADAVAHALAEALGETPVSAQPAPVRLPEPPRPPVSERRGAQRRRASPGDRYAVDRSGGRRRLSICRTKPSSSMRRSHAAPP